MLRCYVQPRVQFSSEQVFLLLLALTCVCVFLRGKKHSETRSEKLCVCVRVVFVSLLKSVFTNPEVLSFGEDIRGPEPVLKNTWANSPIFYCSENCVEYCMCVRANCRLCWPRSAATMYRLCFFVSLLFALYTRGGERERAQRVEICYHHRHFSC
jgi:hypothetical protein